MNFLCENKILSCCHIIIHKLSYTADFALDTLHHNCCKFNVLSGCKILIAKFCNIPIVAKILFACKVLISPLEYSLDGAAAFLLLSLLLKHSITNKQQVSHAEIDDDMCTFQKCPPIHR